MALLINNAKFKNTEISTPELYVRIQFTALANGKSTTVTLITSDTKENALLFKKIDTNLAEQFLLEMLENETQDLAVIHNKVKAELEALGFEVSINLA